MERMENGVLLVGLLVVCVSYLHYVIRTHDLRGILLFWQRRMALSPGEFKWQRAGIVVLFAGIVVRYLNLMQLV